jgi:hypothetical protein
VQDPGVGFARRRDRSPLGQCSPGTWRYLARVGLAAALTIMGLDAGQLRAASQLDGAPSTLLLHAEVPEALAFAAETARQRGWSILDAGPASVTFEQPIESEETGAPAVLRIEALFARSPAGVTVTLRAIEFRASPGGAAETRNVTREYGDNLLNALDSLASKWGLRPAASKQPTAQAAELPTVRASPTPVPPTREAAPGPAIVTSLSAAANALRPEHRVGAWAYYAERHAEGLGCSLSDRGSVLEGFDDTAELHQVHCADGRQVLVRCVDGVCSAAR